jgi:phosphatidylserine decarboxylase
VDCIEETFEPEFMQSRCHRLSILLTIFDVHVQNAPAAGRVAFSRYQRGRFLNALKADSARFNENLLIGIESSEAQGERLGVRQIAGVLARRVVSWVQLGDHVARGQRLGLIRYGSRCDLYLPTHLQVTVRLGEAVKGGETIVARRRSNIAVSPEA